MDRLSKNRFYGFAREPLFFADVRKNLVDGVYSRDHDFFARDARLVLHNIMVVFGEDEAVFKKAVNLSRHFEKLYFSLVITKVVKKEKRS